MYSTGFDSCIGGIALLRLRFCCRNDILNREYKENMRVDDDKK